MKRPNFFLVGAPKCGTTALSEYLRSHTNVFMSQPKEPRFFIRDIRPYTYYNTMKRYLSLFEMAGEKHFAVGEASTQYLASRKAITEIKRFRPDAKIIIMVRNPLEMIPSYHWQLVNVSVEKIEDFETAWRSQERRRQDHNLDSSHPYTYLTQYREFGALGCLVKRWLEAFPREQVKIIVYDDFCSNIRDVYTGVLEFLSVPDDNREIFPIFNPRKKARSNLIKALVNFKPEWLQSTLGAARNFLGVQQFGVRSRVDGWNTRVEPAPALSESMRKELIEAFEDDVLLLSQQIGRDLSNWLR